MFVDEQCVLGHRRLKIIDLSDAARQPMQTLDGSLVITFNGEIYNYRALRHDLQSSHAFRSASDTEVLLCGYEQWGKDVFRRANGMYAAALWEAKRKRLLLVRDRLGKKPLFYYWNRGRVVFGSELKALLRHPEVATSIDEDRLAEFLAFGYVPTPNTIFANIYKVPQGTIVQFEGGKRSLEQYWDLPTEQVDYSEREALEELDALLNDAVRIRLESDVPLGFFLSGGIDSSLVTAIGRRLAGQIRTFCAGFHDPDYDEAPYAQDVADFLGTEHTTLYVDEGSFAEFSDVAVKYYDEPFADSSLIPTYYLAKLTKQHVTIAVSGDGGDELFCGYQKYLNFVQLRPVHMLPLRVQNLLARGLELVPANTTRKISHALRSGISPIELVQWLITIWKNDELGDLMPGSRIQWNTTQVMQTLQRFGARDELSRFMAADIRSYLCDDILQKVDRASMAVALETRCPLLDYRIVELAVRLPIALKFRGGRQKYLLKKLLARYVPERLWKRRKHGFNVPLKSWYRGNRQRHLSEALNQLATAMPRLSKETMQRFMKLHLTGRYDYSQKLFALDMLSQWAAEYRRQ